MRALSLIVVFSTLLSSGVAEAATETRLFTANTTWTAPAGVSTTSAEAWGSGGGGAGSGTSGNAGGGGGAGAYARSVVNVTPGSVYTLVVGAAGAAGASGNNPGGAGTSSMFFSSSTVYATGGAGGLAAASGAGGATTTGSVGTTTFEGGNGGAGVSTVSSGAGGGAGGSSAVGTAAATKFNGVGGATGGGNGAPGVLSGAGAGLTATSTGGGGSGGIRSGGSVGGGAGFSGQVQLTYNLYTVAADTIDPTNASIAPGAATTTVGAFTLQTSTTSDRITSVTVALGSGTYSGIFGVEIWNSADTVVYGTSYNPGADSVTITVVGIIATTNAVTYHIRLKPLTHANMPVVPGSSYAVTASTTALASTGITAGTSTSLSTDISGATMTIDNASPGNVTGATGTGVDGAVNLVWVNSANTDLGSFVVLRASAAVSDIPVEGATYTVGNTIGASTVVCVTSAPVSACADSTAANGTVYHYKIFALDTSGNYASGGTVPTGSPVTPHVPLITQERYIFLNDNGSTTDGYTQAHTAATSTAITNVKKGERLISRFQLSNTDTASTSYSYRIQWENNTDNPNVWNDVGTSTEIEWSLSGVAAPPGHSGQVPLKSAQLGTCTTTTTYIAGRSVAGTGTSTGYTLGPNQCTEFAFAIQTASSTYGKTYRLRMMNGSSNKAFNSYGVYPTLTIESSQNIRYSKEMRGGIASSTLIAVNPIAGYSPIVIGSDGLPVFAYGTLAGAVKLVKCNDPSCSSTNMSTLDSTNGAGDEVNLAIGIDGFPVVSYYSTTTIKMNFAKCNDLACSSPTVNVLGMNSSGGINSSLAIGSDGLPVISIIKDTNNLSLLRCLDVARASYASTTLDDIAATLAYSSIAIGSDGFPVISYSDINYAKLRFYKCNDLGCTSGSAAVLDSIGSKGNRTAIAINSNGYPIIAYQDTSGTANIFLYRCTSVDCSTGSAKSLLDDETSVGTYFSLAIGTDGYPMLSYQASFDHLKYYKCRDVLCSTYTYNWIDDQAQLVGSFNNIFVGSDGFPLITYYNSNAQTIRLMRCNSTDCGTATASSTANLPANNVDLDYLLDDAGYANVLNSDNVYDTQLIASSSRGAYLFAKKNATNTDSLTIAWEGQLSLATTTNIRIYNKTTNAWETLGSSTTPPVNTDYTMGATQSSNMTNYYDANNVAYFRFETATTTGTTTLKTDFVNITVNALGTTTQRAYTFLNDNGATTDGYTQTHAAATSTTITNV